MGTNELFKFSNIDKIRNKLINIKLEDQDGSEIVIKDIIDKINSYINEQLASKEVNVMVQQIYPFISQILAQSITQIVGDEYTAVMILSQKLFRSVFIQEMLLSYYVMKFIQKNNIKIICIEKDTTEEEINSILIKDTINSYGMLAGLSGFSSTETIQALLQSGTVTEQEIRDSNLFSSDQLDSILKKNEN